MTTLPLKSANHHVIDYTMIVLGAFLQAFSYVLFLAPFKIVPGGVYGISIVLHYVSQGVFTWLPDGLPIGITALCFNVPLMLLATRTLGMQSGGKTVVTFLLVSVFTDTLTAFTGGRPIVENDEILSCFYGGALLGLGVALVFRAGGTCAGTDVLARVWARAHDLKVSNLIMVIDSAIVLLALAAFRDWSVPLYSWVAIFLYGKTVSMLQVENPDRAFFIFSENKMKEIADIILKKYGAGGTYLHGRGMYMGKEKEVIFTVANRKHVSEMIRDIKAEDPSVFISKVDATKDFIIGK